MSKVLKGRYFSTTNILLADKDNKPSFAWNSLLHGRDLMKKGLRLLIGNGKAVHLWKDNWLPMEHPRPPCYLHGDPPTDGTVNDLMVYGRNVWNEVKIREVIDPADVEIILNIKLNSEDGRDLLGWHYNDSGLYTVKSGYWLATHHQDLVEPVLLPHGNIGLKQSIWKLQTATKIKHFLWRLLSNALATGTALRHRQIISTATCKRCCTADETTHHLFFLCLYAQMVWRAANINQRSLTDLNVDLDTKIRAILEYNKTDKVAPLFTQLPLWILWQIWKSRNILNYQKKTTRWEIDVNLAIKDSRDWLQANEVHTEEKTDVVMATWIEGIKDGNGLISIG